MGIKTALASLLAAALLAGTARGQDLAPALDPVMLGQGLTLSAMMRAQASRDAARLRSRGRLSLPSAAAARTRFVPSLARRRTQAARFLAAAGRISPELAKSLTPAFRSDPIRFAAPTFARLGLRTDDVADAAAIYLASAWQGANGKPGDPTAVQARGLRDQLRRALTGSPRFRRAPDATKQEMAEGSLYLAFLNDALQESARAHPQHAAKLRRMIADGARATYGLDLTRMRLTPRGLLPA